MCVEAGAQFALSSDAHSPAEVGHAYGPAVEELHELGIEQVVTFERRGRTLEPLG
jgi:histidinol-phosphatase (PHP family)